MFLQNAFTCPPDWVPQPRTSQYIFSLPWKYESLMLLLCVFPGWNPSERPRSILRISGKPQSHWCCECFPWSSVSWCAAWLPHPHHQPAGRGGWQAAGEECLLCFSHNSHLQEGINAWQGQKFLSSSWHPGCLWDPTSHVYNELRVYLTGRKATGVWS